MVAGALPTERRPGHCDSMIGGRLHYYSGEHTAESAREACAAMPRGVWTAAGPGATRLGADAGALCAPQPPS